MLLAGAGLVSAPVYALDVPPATGSVPQDLYLDVVINGLSRDKVLDVRHETDGAWTADSGQLMEAGLLPVDAARRPDGRIDLGRLPGVRFSYDEAGQTLQFSAVPAARSALHIAAGNQSRARSSTEPSADIGGLLNYSLGLNAGYTANEGDFYVNGLWGSFETRAFGPFGVVSNSFTLAASDPAAPIRGNTNWTYTNATGGWRAVAGDVTTGSLDWTRATRLGGVQIQNDFGLRPDVVTFPVPGMSGSAALPSTAEVYVNGIRRYSTQIPDGPFVLDDLPLATGAGDAELVVRDATGRVVTTRQPFFISRRLLRPGLLDYSAELGFARNFYGTDNDQYDSRLMGSTSLRYGLTDWLTLQGHAEGGANLINGGLGADFALGRFGVATAAIAGSSADGQVGLQAFGSLSFEALGARVQVRAQHSFGDYSDVASYTYPGSSDTTKAAAAPPISLAQVSASLPLPIRPLRLNINYTQLETATSGNQRLLGAGFSQSLWGGSFSASGSFDLDDQSYRVGLSFSHALGSGTRASTAVSSSGSGVTANSSITHSMGSGIGDVGWRLTHSGSTTSQQFGASTQVRMPVATTQASVTYDGQSTSGSAELDGAVVATGEGVALAGPIDSAFAVVDAGYPDVPVLVGNRVVGRTGGDGKFVVTSLRPYEGNDIGIDVSGLPLDAAILNAQQQVVPAERSGAVVSFRNKAAGGNALVTFVDPAGKVLALGATGEADPQAPEFMVGYDGQAYVTGLKSANRIVLTLPDGGSCVAEFAFKPENGTQVAIPDVPCQPE
ncbi:MAG: fimbria/pilus outer membrane usher protein [Devosia sp.]|nr:fimbria/pilus outer membrane usher protein [Devosia sp.]